MLCKIESNYPTEIDGMTFFQDNNIENIEIINQYENLVSQGTYDKANDLINQQRDIYGYFADFFNVLENKIYSLQGHILTKEKRQPIIFYDEEERFPMDELHIIYNDYDDAGSHVVLPDNTNNYTHDEIITMIGGHEEDLSTIYFFSDDDTQESIENLLIFWEEEKEPPDANIDTIWI